MSTKPPTTPPPSSGHPDPALHRLLQEWQPTDPLPPRFQESVWSRVEQARLRPEPASVAEVARLLVRALSGWIQTQLPRPALAVAYVAALLAVGGGLGWNQARQESARVREHLSHRYAHSVDPYLAHAVPPR